MSEWRMRHPCEDDDQIPSRDVGDAAVREGDHHPAGGMSERDSRICGCNKE